jgi:hypothetical protein
MAARRIVTSNSNGVTPAPLEMSSPRAAKLSAEPGTVRAHVLPLLLRNPCV